MGLSKLFIGKSTIDEIGCAISGILYPRMLANDIIIIIGNQHNTSVSTIKKTDMYSDFCFLPSCFYGVFYLPLS